VERTGANAGQHQKSQRQASLDGHTQCKKYRHPQYTARNHLAQANAIGQETEYRLRNRTGDHI
jgi:hypothetical protein